MRSSNRKILLLGILAVMFLIPAILAIAAEPAGKAVSPIFGISIPGR
jgi:hypothetical protein